ncbi:MAG TPA: hypothetical protein VIJ83_02545, partial [Solirubrobacteraceae bacterium]
MSSAARSAASAAFAAIAGTWLFADAAHARAHHITCACDGLRHCGDALHGVRWNLRDGSGR